MKRSNIFFTLLCATAIALFSAYSLTADAIPAKRGNTQLTLSDGTTITVRLVGDEHGHWYVDNNGKALRLNNDGYAEYMSNEQIASAKSKRQQRMNTSNARRVRKAPINRAGGQSTVFQGKKKGLVILAEFSDASFYKTNNINAYEDMFNKVGYNLNNHIGSVHDYFLDQSYGKFDLTFDIIGPVKLSKSQKYYGENDEYGNDQHCGEMVCELIKAIDSQVNFANYDWDNDGMVDQVFIVYAGKGEAYYGNPSYTIWPHEWDLLSLQYYLQDGDGPLQCDGVWINTYAMTCELNGNSTTKMDGIGTACHEFSHCMGLPDVYDSDYEENGSGPGMMEWDLLCGGSYNGPNYMGEVPAGYTSYERWVSGWLNPIVLDKPCKIDSIPSLQDEPVAYQIINEGHPDEYYLLENRQQNRWDAYCGGHGMLILHIDYNETMWYENTLNSNGNEQHYTYFPADNSFGTLYSGQYSQTAAQAAGDPFPGTSNNTSFTDTTKPAATLIHANKDGRKFMGKPIEKIAESKEGLISFTFDGGRVYETPNPIDATDITANSFTANWTAVNEAESYDIMIAPSSSVNDPANYILVAENCSKFDGKNSTTDIASSINDFTQTDGWKGAVLYNEEGRIKISSSKKIGYISTPAFTASKDSITVKFCAQRYGTDSNVMKVSLVDEAGTTLATTSITLDTDKKDFLVRFANPQSECRVKFAPTKRAYIYNMYAYDGVYDKETLTADPLSGTGTLIEGITDTHYTFTDLTEEEYMWHVRTVYKDGKSAWSTIAKTKLAKDTVLPGDVNGDGIVSVADLAMMASFILGDNTADINKKAAEVNGDGDITVADLAQVASMILSAN